jgi:hypothetical protein
MNTKAIDSTQDNEVARCVFLEADVADAWCDLVDDPEADIPTEVLGALQMQAALITEAMCQRGQEVIDELLHAIVQDHSAVRPAAANAEAHPPGLVETEVASPRD